MTRREFRAALHRKYLTWEDHARLLSERNALQPKPHPLGNRKQRRVDCARFRTGKMQTDGTPVLDETGEPLLDADGRVVRRRSERELFEARVLEFIRRHPNDIAARVMRQAMLGRQTRKR